jgi:2,3-bisphosphoglycerate-dependent phosphoglycerate mutase
VTADTAPEQPTEFRQTPYAPPPGATELLLVRHGASEPIRPGERFPIVDGHGDPALAPEGHEQAEAVARRLAVERIDAICTTGLRRTVQTAAPLASRLGLEPVVSPGLREVRLGEWEGGLFRQKVHENGPVAQRMWAEERWDVIPGAETNEALAARVKASLDEIVAAHAGRRVAVFVHGGVIAAALAQATSSRPFAFIGADNGSVSHLFVVAGAWVLRRFNDTAHLEPEFTVRSAPPA